MKYQMGIMQSRHANLAHLICMISTSVLHNMQILLALGEFGYDSHILTAARRGGKRQGRNSDERAVLILAVELAKEHSFVARYHVFLKIRQGLILIFAPKMH